MVWALVLACAPACPDGYRADGDRTARLWALTGEQPSGTVCYGRVEELGVRDDEGRRLLDEGRPDALLAARLVHLAMHRAEAVPGPGCEAALLEEEARAWTEELGRRVALGAVDPTCAMTAALGPTPSSEQVRDWLSTSPEPLAASLRASHRRRCSEP
ncbi:MAG: hypothetical protein H6738_18570 [Alphaproteobacteria bacterium]|nr:hypothetical protein [Alphaproteobacteria bacterium]